MKKGQYINLKREFRIFRRRINGKPLIYLDSAATSQKPEQVIRAVSDFYAKHNANVHRGVYQLAEEATAMYEGVRKKVAEFIGAELPEEIIFTRGTTESINLVAYTWGEANIKRGDNIVATIMEHHSNFIPWQELCKRKNAQLRLAPITREGKLDVKKFYELIDRKTKLVAITHASNVLGTIKPIANIARNLRIKNNKLRILVDGAQAVSHMPINVGKLDCDFYPFSGHKMLGPTGVGVLYAKKDILEKMPPFLFGGNMIRRVSTTARTAWNDVPWKFEAGTASIAQVIGLGAAINYLQKIGMRRIAEHDHSITSYVLNKMKDIRGIEIYGPRTAQDRVGVIAFNIKGIHPHDLATLLDKEGIAVRAGHHCAMPLHREALGTEASVRISLYIYNSEEDVDIFIKALEKICAAFTEKLY